MGMADRRTIQDDQHFETNPDGSAVRWQSIRVQEWWETIGADGKPYVTQATRDEAIYEHLKSNAGLSNQRAEMTARGIACDVIGEPLHGVRHVVRYETASAWEDAGDIEPVDVLAEIADQQPCPHPPERAMKGGSRYTSEHWFCGRCYEKLPPKGES